MVTIHMCDGKEKIGRKTNELGVRDYRSEEREYSCAHKVFNS